MRVVELLQHGVHVVTHVDQADGTSTERSPSVALQIDGNHLPSGGKHRHDRRKHVDRSKSTVEQKQWLALTTNLVVVVDAMRLDVAGLDRNRFCHGILKSCCFRGTD